MLRIGLAGIGTIAEVYINLFVQNKIHGGVITALSSRNMSHLAEIQNRHSLSQVSLFSDYTAMLNSGLIDVVLICTPHRLHISMAMQALQAGVHPLIEKPLGVCYEDTLPLLDYLKKNPHLKAGILYCLRTMPIYQRIKSLLDSGAIGTLKRVTWLTTAWYRTPAYHASGSWRSSWTGEGGGLLMNQAAHHLDLLTWLCGAPSEVSSCCEFGIERHISVETDASLFLRYPNGAVGQFISSSREFPGTNRLELSGSGGQIIMEDETSLLLRRLSIDEQDFASATSSFFGPIPYQESKESFPPSPNTDKQAAVVTDFLSAVASHSAPICPLEEGALSLALSNAAYLSAWTGRSVSCPPPGDMFLRELELHCQQESVNP